jgi:hypothetical protein
MGVVGNVWKHSPKLGRVVYVKYLGYREELLSLLMDANIADVRAVTQ